MAIETGAKAAAPQETHRQANGHRDRREGRSGRTTDQAPNQVGAEPRKHPDPGPHQQGRQDRPDRIQKDWQFQRGYDLPQGDIDSDAHGNQNQRFIFHL